MATTDPTGKAAPAGGFQTGGWYSGYQYWDGTFAPQAGMIHASSNQQGAGQMVSREVNQAESIRQGNAPSANQEYIDKLNAANSANYSASNLESTGGVSAYLNNYQSQLMEKLSSAIGTVPSMEELKASLTPSTTLPDPLNRVAQREQMRLNLGVAELETELQTIKDQEQAIKDQLYATTGLEETKTVAMNVISGRINEEERVANIRLRDITRQKDSIVNELNTKYNIINTYMTDIGLDYQDAVERYNSEFSRNLQIQQMRIGMQETYFNQVMDVAKFSETVRQNQIDNARANLTTLSNAIMNGNMNMSNMSSDQKIQIQKLEIMSGLPVGTVANLKMSPKDSILKWSDDGSQVVIMNQDGTFGVKSTGLPKSNSSTKITAQELNQYRGEIAAAFANGVSVKEIMSMYVGLGVSSDEITKLYMLSMEE